MVERYVCLWVHSLRTWRYSESRDDGIIGDENVNKAIIYMFADGKRAGDAYVTKSVANVKMAYTDATTRHRE